MKRFRDRLIDILEDLPLWKYAIDRRLFYLELNDVMHDIIKHWCILRLHLNDKAVNDESKSKLHSCWHKLMLNRILDIDKEAAFKHWMNDYHSLNDADSVLLALSASGISDIMLKYAMNSSVMCDFAKHGINDFAKTLKYINYEEIRKYIDSI